MKSTYLDAAPETGPPSLWQKVSIRPRGEATHMHTPVAELFRSELAALREKVVSIPAALADLPWRQGGWTRKQIVGHLLDSAANNRQRFVRAAIDGAYEGPSYSQEAWVAAHGYAQQSWQTLVQWWQVEHDIMAAIVDRIPEERLAAPCTVGSDAPVTLRYLIEDYARHQRWHVNQLAPASC